MITLVLTEKPSVAKDFARALQVGTRKTGYFEGNDYVITWAVGHLLELAEPQDYDAKWSRWRMDSLPILPRQLRYKPIGKSQKQLSVVQKQLKRKDLGDVVIATDAGREGEVIARTILHSVSDFSFERAFRFWTSQALTPQVVQETLSHLKPSSDFDRLWHAGQARQFADWLVGMNLTRAATLKFGSHRDVFSVGRVQTAVLALLVDRRRERDRFVPKPYWLLRVLFVNFRGTWRGSWFRKDRNRFDDVEPAEQMLALVSGQTGRVASVKREKKRQPPPSLFSLTDLQRDANAKFAFSAKQTLDIAQKLYEERKCLSYPRTDSRVLGSRNVDLARQIVGKLEKVYPELFSGHDPKLVSAANKRVFNDAKLTDHHALIPLAPLPGGAAPQEKRIYDLVLKRFAAAFHPDYEYEATEIITEVAGETFRTKGSRPLKPGWKAVYGMESSSATSRKDDDELDEENLPPLEKGDDARVDEAKLEEKTTQPPPEYTEALLLKDMVNPSRFVTEEELQKIFKGEVGLGTQATRAQIIETLILRRYVNRDRKHLVATEKGCLLIDQLRQFERAQALASPEETARWEMELEKIAQGVGRPEAFIEMIREFVEAGIRELKSTSSKAPSLNRTIGRCPACDGEIIEGRKGFGCRNWRPQNGGCRFVIWKEISGRPVDAEMVRQLLAGESVGPLVFRSESGRDFAASLVLERQESGDQGSISWTTRLVMAGKSPAGGESPSPGRTPPPSPLDVIGRCPRCGGQVIEGKKGYGCANWRPEDGKCSFVIWKVVAGKTLSRKAVTDLLKKGETTLLRGFTARSGKKFSAKLRLEGEDFRTTFVTTAHGAS